MVKMAEESSSVASQRAAKLSKTVGRKLTPRLWTGITEVLPGAGIAVVGNPQQVAGQLMEFVEAGCSGLCLWVTRTMKKLSASDAWSCLCSSAKSVQSRYRQ